MNEIDHQLYIGMNKEPSWSKTWWISHHHGVCPNGALAGTGAAGGTGAAVGPGGELAGAEVSNFPINSQPKI